MSIYKKTASRAAADAEQDAAFGKKQVKKLTPPSDTPHLRIHSVFGSIVTWFKILRRPSHAFS